MNRQFGSTGFTIEINGCATKTDRDIFVFVLILVMRVTKYQTPQTQP